MAHMMITDVPNPVPVREWNDIVLHGYPRCGRNGRIQPQSFSHNVIQAHERLDLLLVRRFGAEMVNLVTQALLYLNIV